MKRRHSGTDMESADRVLSQYESLRSQVLKKQGTFPERNLGLALLIHQGMLAWIETCHKCIPANATLDKQTVLTEPPYETKSDMIKVLANITLLNLKEASSCIGHHR